MKLLLRDQGQRTYVEAALWQSSHSPRHTEPECQRALMLENQKHLCQVTATSSHQSLFSDRGFPYGCLYVSWYRMWLQSNQLYPFVFWFFFVVRNRHYILKNKRRIEREIVKDNHYGLSWTNDAYLKLVHYLEVSIYSRAWEFELSFILRLNRSW